MEQFELCEIKEWLSEGIKLDTTQSFMVRYYRERNAIVFPIFDNFGNIINICCRTLYDDYKERGIPKYVYLYKMGGLDFFYGYYQHERHILNSREIIIVEGAKSVFKLVQWGYLNSVASLTDALSPHQVQLLANNNNIDSIILAWDKGVDWDLIKKRIRILSKIKSIYIVDDKDSLLCKKESPVDRGKKTWEQLYNLRYKVII